MLDSRIEGWDDVAAAWQVLLREHHLPTYAAAGDLRRRIDQLEVVLFTNGLENIARFHFNNYRGVALATQPRATCVAVLNANANPRADGRFVLQAPAGTGPVSVRVTDAQGRRIKQLTFATGLPAQAVLDLGPPPAGVYLAEVRGANTVARTRLEVR